MERGWTRERPQAGLQIAQALNGILDPPGTEFYETAKEIARDPMHANVPVI
jgi:hypothetical protein